MHSSRLLFAIAILLALSGCGPSDPLDHTVSASSPARFAAWRAHVMSDGGVETRKHVDEALQEIRMSITGERELKRQRGERVASGSEEIDEAVRQRVDGRTLRQVVQLGYELRVRRLKEELAGLENAMSKNAQLVTRPGDLESKQHLEGLRDRQLVRVEKYREDLAAAERELMQLQANAGPAKK